MKKLIIAVIVVLIAIPSVGAWAEEKEYRSGIATQGPLDVDVWVDNDDGIYYEGESITVFFQASQDCFLALYSLDTRGNVSLLYPVNPWDNGFVSGGEVYAVPGDYDDYELIVTGPEGIEHIQAVASLEEMEIPDWHDSAPSLSGSNDDPEDFLEYLNNRYFTTRWENRDRAMDHLTVYVKAPRYYYKPVYVPRTWYDYPYYSMVYIDYPFGAEIYIDGIYFGIAPLWIPRVMVGWHWVTIYDRYGYCWEQHIDFVHNHTIRLDRSRIKTSRTFSSRFKDVRLQAKKYSRSNYLLSDQKVTSTRLKDARSEAQSKRAYDRTKSTSRTQTKRIEDTWNRQSTGSKKSDNAVRRNEGTSRKSTPDIRQGGSSKKSGNDSNVGRSSGKSGSTKKSTGTTIKKSGGSRKSSGSNSSGTKKSGGGNISRSSGQSKSSSSGRTSSGRSSSGKSSSSSSSRSSKKGGGR